MNEIVQDERGQITILTLNRAELGNALTPAMLTRLGELVAAFDADPVQKVLVIRGAGEKAFCSGVDLSVMLDEMGTGSFVPMSRAPDMAGLAACKKPVIAAINGLAVGGGMEIAMCCDIRIAVDNAWFALPEAGHGFIAGVAAVLMPRLLPLGMVMDMMLAGERLSAAEALRHGFVQKIVRPDALMNETLAKAERIATFSQPALWGTKQALRFWHDAWKAEHHRHYEAIVHRVMLAGDMDEGLKAFRERRKPVFTRGEWPNPFGKK